jgi:hypothetical protein
VNQEVRHSRLVDGLGVIARFLNRAHICRQSIEVFDLVDAQLIEHVAVLGQLPQIVVVPDEIPIPRVVGSKELQPSLDSSTTDSEAAAELSSHLLDTL